MDYKNVIKTLKRDLNKIIGFSLVFTLVVLGIYYILPASYTAQGDIYIYRVPENSIRYFTYEGYYSQLTAQDYTNTAIGILNSTSNKQKALSKVGIPTTKSNIQKLSRRLDVKKQAPQLIHVSFTAPDENGSLEMWNSVTQSALDEINSLNKQGDSALKAITPSNPSAVQNYIDPVVLFIGTFLLGLTGMIAYIFGKEYLRTSK